MVTLTQTFQDIADAIRDKGIEGKMTPREMPNNIRLIQDDTTDGIPEGVAIDGVKWDETWEAKGQNGTIVDIVVGDELCHRLDAAVYVSNITNTNKAIIDWGDGNTTQVTVTSESTIYNHTYASAGHYVITIDNNAGVISFVAKTATLWYMPNQESLNNTSIGNMRLAVRRVRQYGSALKKAIYCFSNCIYLNSEEGGYPDELPPFPPGITTILGVYSNCVLYKGHIPYLAHMTNCTTVQTAFNNCRNMQGTCQILPPKTTACQETFKSCYNLSAIPYDIFPDSLATTLTSMNGVFMGTGAGIVKPIHKYPRIEHLTKCTIFRDAFASQRLCYGELPKLPPSAQNCYNMFYQNTGDITIDEDYFDNCTNLQTIEIMFHSCWDMRGRCPRLPSTITGATGLRGAFKDCQMMGGTFPTLPSNYVGDMSSIFYDCFKVEGSLPDIPQKVTNLTTAFYCCSSASGRVPSMGHLDNLNSGNMVSSCFYGCENLEDPPLTFLDPTKIGGQTTFTQMFAYCRRLKEFTFDLSGFTTVTDTSHMFRECVNLKHGPTKLPPNVKTVIYIFSHCTRLMDQPIPLGDYASLTNIAYSYQQTQNLHALRNESGDIELRKEKYLHTGITTVTNAFLHSSVDVCKQFQDASVAFGKSANWLGTVVIPNYSYCIEYTGGIS